MHTKLLILLSSLFLYQAAAGQALYSKVQVKSFPADSFSFSKSWDYSWEVVKDDKGKFSKNNDGLLKNSDTAHLYYSANCSTNVQGGFHMRYCYAGKSSSSITLIFSDGLPAFTSQFFVYVAGDSFYFRPKTVYPAVVNDQNISYKVTKQELFLNKRSYQPREEISGYIDVEFQEIVSSPGSDTVINNYYLKGFIKTRLSSYRK